MRRLCVILALAALFAGVAHAEDLGVSADFVLGKSIYLPDEDVDLKLHLANRSGQALSLGETPDWIQFSIRSLNGSILDKHGDMPTGEPFTLGSSKEATLKFNPTPYYEIRQPGRYIINAAFRIPQWNVSVPCNPVTITVVNGTPLLGVAGLSFGVPPAAGATDTKPEIRHYGLVKVAYEDQLKLYFRLTDDLGRSLRCYPVGRMLSFSSPEVKLDPLNNFHLFWQTGARDFTYVVIKTDGDMLIREIHSYTDTRPKLKANDDGNVSVVGGVRKVTPDDLPAPMGEAKIP